MAVRYFITGRSATYVEPVTAPTVTELVGPATVIAPIDPNFDEPVNADFIDTGSVVPSSPLASSPSVQYVVKVGWEAVPANAFVLNESQLDSSNELQSAYTDFLNIFQFGISQFDGVDRFADAFSAAYSEISDDVKAIRIRRGRDDNLSDFEAGQAIVVLNDPDARYSPLNSSSDLYPNVVPGRQIVIEALLNGERYGMFRGFVRSIEHDPESSSRTTTLQCQDMLLYLSRYKPVLAAQSTPITTGEAIGVILDELGWDDPSLRQLGYGDFLPSFGPFDGSKSALEIIRDLMLSERGEFYHGRDGVVRFFFRHARAIRESGFSLDGAVAGAIPASDLTNIRNRAIVTVTGLGSQTALDTTSITNYGPSEITLETPYIDNASTALSLAQWLVAQGKEPQPPIRAVEYMASKDYATMFLTLTSEIGSRLFVSDSAVNLDEREFYIEGIEHDITPGFHRAALTLSRVPEQAPLIFGTTRMISGVFQSPSGTASPYTTTGTSPDLFAY
jgi:hypothetical protein